MRRLSTGLAAGGLILSGFTIELIETNGDRATAENSTADLSPSMLGAPFFDPAATARALCSPTDDGTFSTRRAAFVSAAAAYAATLATSDDDTAGNNNVPFWPGLGELTLPITTDSDSARRYFDQGFRLMVGFNHLAAIESFRAAQAADPGCAMCYWGEALALGPNINAPMAQSAVEPAYSAIRRAENLVDTVSPLERDLIAALSNRYASDPAADRAALDAAYADAMAALAQKYPNNDDVLALYAEAAMDTQPWDYWDADGRTPKGRMKDVLNTLETILARNSTHAAAIHLYIHTAEASTRPERAEAGADRLAALMPGAGHIVHMPAHIYYRIGRYKDSIATNLKAVAADEAFLAKANASPLYQFGYYTHNIHFVLTSAQMAGDRETALRMADLLDERLPVEMASIAPWVQPIKAAPLLAKVQFNAFDAVLAAEKPADDLPFLQAMWHYARGEAFARLGRLDEARTELAALKGMADVPAFYVLDGQGLPATGVGAIAADLVSARIALAEGNRTEAIKYLESAVAGQDALPYTEPPFWYYPIRQTLGAVLVMDGQPERAERVFMQTLVNAPNNGWAYFGLARAFDAMDNPAGAEYARHLMKRAWAGASAPDGLERL